MEQRTILNAGYSGIEIAVPKGYFVCWNFTTQAAFRVDVKLYDDLGKVYMDQSRQSANPMPDVSGCDFMTGNKLMLQIEIPQSRHIELRKNEWDITDPGAGLLARSIVLLAEDYTDYDFNDVQISITAFKNKG